MIRVEPATTEHARVMAQQIAFFGCLYSEAERETIAVRHVERSCEAWVWLQGEEPIALAGVFPGSLIARTGVVWALLTPAALANTRAFWRASRAVTRHLRTSYARIYGGVDVRFEASIRWLARLGFGVNTDKSVPWEGRVFHPFVMER